MHTPWHFLPHVVALSLLGGLYVGLQLRAATRSQYSWSDIRTPILWMSSGIALFGILFFVARVAHPATADAPVSHSKSSVHAPLTQHTREVPWPSNAKSSTAVK